MVWLLIDAENYFKELRTDYGIKKGSKGILQHSNKIQRNEFLLIYDVSRKNIEQIYRVNKTVYPTNNNSYPRCIDLYYVDKLDNPITFEEMRELLPNSEYVNDYHRRAIGKISPNEWRKLKNHLLKNNQRFSDLLQLFAEAP